MVEANNPRNRIEGQQISPNYIKSAGGSDTLMQTAWRATTRSTCPPRHWRFGADSMRRGSGHRHGGLWRPGTGVSELLTVNLVTGGVSGGRNRRRRRPSRSRTSRRQRRPVNDRITGHDSEHSSTDGGVNDTLLASGPRRPEQACDGADPSPGGAGQRHDDRRAERRDVFVCDKRPAAAKAGPHHGFSRAARKSCSFDNAVMRRSRWPTATSRRGDARLLRRTPCASCGPAMPTSVVVYNVHGRVS